MTRRGSEFAGLSVALVTPFKAGAVDFDALQSQVEFQVEAGTICVCPVGTTGESPTLTHDEHDRVISAVVEASAGRIKVMAGTGSNSTAEALRLTQWAATAGADAALSGGMLGILHLLGITEHDLATLEGPQPGPSASAPPNSPGDAAV